MKTKKNNLSLIIPCYNEADNLSSLIKILLEIQTDCHEIILVNNGSTDNTSSKISGLINEHESCIKVLDLKKNIGYGHGIMAGVKEASGQVIAWTHADLQTDPKDVIYAYKFYIKNGDYRNCILKGKRIGRNFFDNFFTVFMGIICSFVMKIKLSDVNAQPKMFHHSFRKFIKDAPNDFSLDLYVLIKAITNNYTVLEYPVNFGNRIFGSSKGGGTLFGKIKLILRTLSYIKRIRLKLKD
tara:strand:+ start:2859 stop:3578 length:720 start_codon:yes stop_codon:yes gene_type:complete